MLYEFVVACQEIHGVDDEKRTFFQWASMVLGIKKINEDIIREIDYALQQINEMDRQATKLLQVCKIHVDIELFDESFVKRIKRIQNICQRITREQKRRKYNNCLNIISKELINELNEYNNVYGKYEGIVLEDLKKPFKWDELDGNIEY